MFLFSFFLLIKGFCCWCSEQDKWRGSFKDTTPFSRAGLSCKVFGKAQAAAHCMKYDDLWYVSIESLSLAAYSANQEMVNQSELRTKKEKCTRCCQAREKPTAA